jgi:phosphoribosyl 1,2-cyclic phosphate phosphodiesterase
MKITILGTGTSQGIPVIGCHCDTCLSFDPKDKRLRTSAFVETGGLKLLIDTSADFRQQMLINKIDDIDAVLYTHHHVDHILGMDDLRQINQRLKKYIGLYGNKHTLDEIKITFRYVFYEELVKHRAVPLVNFNYIEPEKFYIKDIPVIPIEIMHGNLMILGYRINSFAYITDCSFLPESEYSKLKDLDVLVLNALRIRSHPTHFNLEQAISAAGKINAKMTYFTHITHEMKHDVVSRTLPGNMHLAYDGLELNI